MLVPRSESRPGPSPGERCQPAGHQDSCGEAAHAKQPLPAVLGLDMAGTVEEVGPGVTTFSPGDEVYGMVGGVGGEQGTLAEFVAVDANLLALKPSQARALHPLASV